jgi:hypothetical protein
MLTTNARLRLVAEATQRDTTITEKTENRIPFHVYLSFDEPTTGTILVAASDKAHAEKLVNEGFANKKNLAILDIYPANAVDYGEKDVAAPESIEDIVSNDKTDSTIETQKKRLN